MTQAELIENLGTIARSGSKAFVKELREQGSGSQASNIIGQFGVGFYSTFMVADKVEVFSKSGPIGRDGVGHHWVSTGAGTYEVSEAEGTLRGTKIILHLRPDCKQFSIRSSLELIVKKYSNFVGFPIFLNNKKVNTVEAIWTQDRCGKF
jgi:TNF receptor-associated protein 1